MRVLVCGSREWGDRWPIERMVVGLSVTNHPDVLTIIHGAARGADTLAGNVVQKLWSRGYPVVEEPYPAEWDKHGKAAGAIRNQRMLDDGKPDVVVAFTDNLLSSNGTWDMVQRAQKAGVTTYVIGRPK